MENVIVVFILVVIVAAIIGYLIRAKKRGETCVGCPYSKQCSSQCGGGCSDPSNRKSCHN